MTVDLSKIRPGDEVTVRGWFAGHDHNLVNVCWTPSMTGQVDTFSAYSIVSHTPKALGVGDRVRSRHSDATVLALHGDDACIVFDTTGEMGIRPARMLERIP